MNEVKRLRARLLALERRVKRLEAPTVVHDEPGGCDWSALVSRLEASTRDFMPVAFTPMRQNDWLARAVEE